MAGATSLVQLILKKWGDDAAGAAKELEEKVGFPESVANRIATGELPMDAESVARRAQDQGYDTSNLLYHGTEENVTEFAPSGGGELGGGVYVTRDPSQASEYARRQYGGPYHDGANVIPVYSKPLKPVDRDGWVKSRSENMGRLKQENDGEWQAKFVKDAEQEIANDVTSEGYGGIYLNNPMGERSLMYDQGVIYDPNDIRSPNAAFDPQYTGSNIMGEATVPLLGATAAGTAGLLAAPMLADKDKPLPVPTWGDIGESVMNVLGMPMTGLQGLARGGYGLLTGEDFTEAAAQAGNTMDVGWKDGLLDVSGMNPDKGADQAEAYVTEKTGDESLGWMAKMGLLFGGL